MTQSEYEAFGVSTSEGKSIEPIRMPPIVTCSTGCGRPVICGDHRCVNCYEEEVRQRIRRELNIDSKPLTHF
jgi:hypothetical protein